jgi:predicted Zn-dependent protease
VNLLSLGAEVLAAAKKRAPGGEAEAFLAASESRSQDWSEGKPENAAVSRSHGIGLRLVDEGRLGFASTNRADAESVSWLTETAAAAA